MGFTGAGTAATLAVNKACQCRCEHCSAYHYNRSRKPELSAALWREAISQSVRLGVTQLIFVGGEPLLRKVIEFIQAGKRPLTMAVKRADVEEGA